MLKVRFLTQKMTNLNVRDMGCRQEGSDLETAKLKQKQNTYYALVCVPDCGTSCTGPLSPPPPPILYNCYMLKLEPCTYSRYVASVYV
jgi:hypothetical protein